jgi:hypothetical protein
VLQSGALVRWIEVSPVNPLIHDTDGAEHIARAFTSIAARLPDDRQSLELVAQATPLAIDALLVSRAVNSLAKFGMLWYAKNWTTQAGAGVD